MKPNTKFYKAYLLPLLTVTFLVYSCEGNKKEEKPVEVKEIKATPLIPYTIANKYPHDTTSYTEGFLFHDNRLLESSGTLDNGGYARSAFGIADLDKGKIDIKQEL